MYVLHRKLLVLHMKTIKKPQNQPPRIASTLTVCMHRGSYELAVVFWNAPGTLLKREGEGKSSGLAAAAARRTRCRRCCTALSSTLAIVGRPNYIYA